MAAPRLSTERPDEDDPRAFYYEELERDHARHGIDHADPWSDRRLAAYVVSIPQHFVHRFGNVKRIVHSARGSMLPQHLREQTDSTVKPDATALFDRGLLDRSRVAMEALIQDFVAADLGFVDKSVLWDDYQGLLAGRPDRYDIWGFWRWKCGCRRTGRESSRFAWDHRLGNP